MREDVKACMCVPASRLHSCEYVRVCVCACMCACVHVCACMYVNMQQAKQTLITAIGIGAVLGLCAILLIWLVRKNPQKAKKILARTTCVAHCAYTTDNAHTVQSAHPPSLSAQKQSQNACRSNTHSPHHEHSACHDACHKQRYPHKVSFLSVEVLIAIKTVLACLDFYTESAVLQHATHHERLPVQSHFIRDYRKPPSLIRTCGGAAIK